jgi:hypothetical protein
VFDWVDEGVQILLLFGKKKSQKPERKCPKILEKKHGKKTLGKKMANNPNSIGILKEFGKK